MNIRYMNMMTELCLVHERGEPIKEGCTAGISEAPYMLQDVYYETLEDAHENIKQYRSTKSGLITGPNNFKVYGVREFYIEKIKVDSTGRKILSYGPVEHCKFATYEDGEPEMLPEPPPVHKRCSLKGFDGHKEETVKLLSDVVKKKGKVTK